MPPPEHHDPGRHEIERQDVERNDLEHRDPEGHDVARNDLEHRDLGGHDVARRDLEGHDVGGHDGLPDDDALLEAIRSSAPGPEADPTQPGPAASAVLAHLGGLVRSLSDDDVSRDDPPLSVWAGIAARTGHGAPGLAPIEGAGDLAAEPEVAAERTSPAPIEGAGPGVAFDQGGEPIARPAPEAPPPSAAPPGEPVALDTDDPSGWPRDRYGPSLDTDDASGSPRDRYGPPSGSSLDAAAPALDDGTSSGVVPLHARRRSGRPAWLVGAAAAVTAVLLVAVGVVVTRDGDDDPVVVASARLEPLPDQPTGDATSVEAQVVEKDGGLQLDLPLADSGLPVPAGFYEVWLIDPDIDGMVSLGPVRADGVYAVPGDVDVAAFPIVDVSVEPPDGVPTHSGVSVLRGTLA